MKSNVHLSVWAGLAIPRRSRPSTCCKERTSHLQYLAYSLNTFKKSTHLMSRKSGVP